MKMLTEGKGNLVRRTENLRVLGLKNSKTVNTNLVDRGMQGDNKNNSPEE
jgi:hypothetical protein